MVDEMRATTGAELEPISGYLHDRWFDLDAVVLDEGERELRVPYLSGFPGRQGFWRRLLRKPHVAPHVAGVLVVRNVAEHSIDDRAGIGCFDFGVISYDDSASLVEIRSNFPLEIRITVHQLDVTLSFA
jgi:hypothetical protein